jgi:hypothetical protein
MSYVGFGSISGIIHLLARLGFTSRLIVIGALLIVLCR